MAKVKGKAELVLWPTHSTPKPKPSSLSQQCYSSAQHEALSRLWGRLCMSPGQQGRLAGTPNPGLEVNLLRQCRSAFTRHPLDPRSCSLYSSRLPADTSQVAVTRRFGKPRLSRERAESHNFWQEPVLLGPSHLLEVRGEPGKQGRGC